jgi:hypothetical protein
MTKFIGWSESSCQNKYNHNIVVVRIALWCARRDLNLRPPASETVTLSTELRALIEETLITLLIN